MAIEVPTIREIADGDNLVVVEVDDPNGGKPEWKITAVVTFSGYFPAGYPLEIAIALKQLGISNDACVKTVVALAELNGLAQS